MPEARLIVRDWVAALKSGKHAKSTGFLKVLRASGLDNVATAGDCCLGVALELVGVPWKEASVGESYGAVSFDGYSEQNWVGTISYHDLHTADLLRPGAVTLGSVTYTRFEGADGTSEAAWIPDDKRLLRLTTHEIITRINDDSDTFDSVIAFLEEHINQNAVIRFQWGAETAGEAV